MWLEFEGELNRFTASEPEVLKGSEIGFVQKDFISRTVYPTKLLTTKCVLLLV